MSTTPLARLRVDRRRDGRRETDGRVVIATHWVFDAVERAVLKLLERRRLLRRTADHRRALTGDL
ncbi:MAG: hypothetical protein IT371_26795 [Deltaproteobacteria bacterium]|nr:hypothetical protein [Deltaproteobacteria bacterium]